MERQQRIIELQDVKEDDIQVDPPLSSTLDMSQKLVENSEDMASIVVHKDSTVIDGNQFIDNKNTYHAKDNFKSTVNELLTENSALLVTDNL